MSALPGNQADSARLDRFEAYIETLFQTAGLALDQGDRATGRAAMLAAIELMKIYMAGVLDECESHQAA